MNQGRPTAVGLLVMLVLPTGVALGDENRNKHSCSVWLPADGTRPVTVRHVDTVLGLKNAAVQGDGVRVQGGLEALQLGVTRQESVPVREHCVLGQHMECQVLPVCCDLLGSGVVPL